MANKTDKGATSVHGTDPQNLIEKIVRGRIYANTYWKEHCFALNEEGLVDKAMDLKSFGGSFGGNKKPTPFLCLTLKMLQIQPSKDIVIEFIRNQDHKYVRLLGAFYLRLVGKPVEIYEYLEPLYNDFRKIRKRSEIGSGYAITHVDEFIEELLTKDFSLDTALPYLPKRVLLEDNNQLDRRVSVLENDLDSESENEKEEAPEKDKKSPPPSSSPVRDDRRSRKSRSRSRSRSRERKDDRDKNRSRDDHRDSDRDRRRDSDRGSDHKSSRRDDRDDRRGGDDRKDSRRSDDRGRSDSRRSDDRSDRNGHGRDRDDNRKRDREDEDRGQSKKSKSNEEVASVEETNKMRAKLGLKPLK